MTRRYHQILWCRRNLAKCYQNRWCFKHSSQVTDSAPALLHEKQLSSPAKSSARAQLGLNPPLPTNPTLVAAGAPEVDDLFAFLPLCKTNFQYQCDFSCKAHGTKWQHLWAVQYLQATYWLSGLCTLTSREQHSNRGPWSKSNLSHMSEGCCWDFIFIFILIIVFLSWGSNPHGV